MLTIPDVSTAARGKIARRLLPFLFVIYITAYIDRVNVGFAGLQMTRKLGFSNEVFGFGAGVFFFGYCLLEIPGAVLAQRWSARKWFALIMVGWGLLATVTGFIQSATQFAFIRFLLGFAEGGFFPAVVVYLTHWFRQQDRAKAIALFMAAIPVANAIGAPVAAWLLDVNWLGISGWRWVLILEGLPPVVLGVVTLFYLTDWPRQAKWLTPDERDWISGELDRELRERKGAHGHLRLIQAFTQPVVLVLAFSYFLLNTSGYGLTIWLPKLVAKFPGLTTWQVSLVAAIPPLCAIPAMLVVGWHSDKTGERKWHAAAAAFAAAAGFAISQYPGAGPVVAIVGFSLAAMGIMSYYPPYWSVPPKVLSPEIAAASFGFINLIANLGGFAGPYMIGFLTDLTGSFGAGVLLLVTTAILSGASLAALRLK